MQILFEPGHPKNLLSAIQLIHNMDKSENYQIELWQGSINIANKNDSIVFIFDSNKRGLAITTQKYFEEGYRIFAFKMPKGNMDFFNFSLTILSLWPKFLHVAKSEQASFVYTYKYGGRKITKVI